MTDSQTSLGSNVDDQAGVSTPVDRWGTTLAGALIVAIGAGMLAERIGLLSLQWRTAIWPVLLMVFGVASLLRPDPDGRHGLFYVFAGAWWYAGLAGWISMSQTWPLLIVGLGVSVVLQSLTARGPRWRHVWRHGRHGRRESGLMPLVLVAIVVGAILSSRDRLGSFVETSDGAVNVVSVMGTTQHQLAGETLPGGRLVTVMGRSTLDLRRATVAPGRPVVLDEFTIMGRSILYVPSGWEVDLSSLSVFGRVRDRRTGAEVHTALGAPSVDPPSAPVTPSAPAPVPGDAGAGATAVAPRLQLRGAVVFGNLEIRSTDDAAEGDRQ